MATCTFLAVVSVLREAFRKGQCRKLRRANFCAVDGCMFWLKVQIPWPALPLEMWLQRKEVVLQLFILMMSGKQDLLERK